MSLVAPRPCGGIARQAAHGVEGVAAVERLTHFQGAGESQVAHLRGVDRIHHLAVIAPFRDITPTGTVGGKRQGVALHAQAVLRQHRDFQHAAGVASLNLIGRDGAGIFHGTTAGNGRRGFALAAPDVQRVVAHVTGFRIEDVLTSQGAAGLEGTADLQVTDGRLARRVNHQAVLASVGLVVITAVI